MCRPLFAKTRIFRRKPPPPTLSRTVSRDEVPKVRERDSFRNQAKRTQTSEDTLRIYVVPQLRSRGEGRRKAMSEEPNLEEITKWVHDHAELERKCKHDILTLRYHDVKTGRTVYRCSECNHPFEWYREKSRPEVEKP